MKRDTVVAGLAWAVVSLLGEVALWNLSIFPAEDAREAGIADSAFRVLIRMSVPVFALALVLLVYSVIRFRSRGTPTGPGAQLWGNKSVYVVWLVGTGLLAVLLIVNPGLTGLADIRGESRADLVVHMTARQWEWEVTYPSYEDASTLDEMVLPVGKRIRFEVASEDVLHSFWIPTFRVKVDAVPGQTTVVYATPTRVDSFALDDNVRVQCAELCGLGHSYMSLPVRVVPEDQFEAWASKLASSQESG